MEEVLCPLCGSDEAVPVLRAGSRQMVRCRHCRLVYRSPRPSEAELIRAAIEDGPEGPEEEWLAARRARNFHRFLDRWAGSPGRLLDVGCGSGGFVRMARERGWEAVGVDLSPGAVRSARERLGVPALCGDLKTFRFPAHAFTLVTLWNVLDYVTDPVGLLREIHRVLEPGGALFVRTPNYLFQRLAFALTGWGQCLGPAGRLAERPHLTFFFNLISFTPASLRLLLDRSGFVPLKVANSPPTWGDPYRAVGGAEHLLTAAKVGVHGLVQALYVVSVGRWVLGPSLEAYARREG